MFGSFRNSVTKFRSVIFKIQAYVLLDYHQRVLSFLTIHYLSKSTKFNWIFKRYFSSFLTLLIKICEEGYWNRSSIDAKKWANNLHNYATKYAKKQLYNLSSKVTHLNNIIKSIAAVFILCFSAKFLLFKCFSKLFPFDIPSQF